MRLVISEADRTSSRADFSVSARPFDTVASLRASIAAAAGLLVCADDVLLYYDGRALAPTERLVDAGVAHDGALLLLVRRAARQSPGASPWCTTALSRTSPS